MANLFEAKLGKLFPALGQLDQAGVTDEMWERLGRKDGEYARVVYEALMAKMNGVTVPSTDAVTFPPDGPPYRTKPRNGNGEIRTGEYVVPVSYQLPPYAELNGSVFDWASDLFSNKYTWKEHESVRGLVDRTPGERTFLVKHFNREMTSDEVIAWADENGYRVATHEEAVDFAKAQPGLQRQFPIVALGSFTVLDGCRYVAFLYRNDAKRFLVLDRFGGRWGANYRFLLVRK